MINSHHKNQHNNNNHLPHHPTSHNHKPQQQEKKKFFPAPNNLPLPLLNLHPLTNELPCKAQISKKDFTPILKGNNEISFKYTYFPILT